MNDYKKILKSKEKEERSKRGKASRNKGASYENKIAKILGEAFNIVLKRTPSSGGFSKQQKNPFFCGDLTCVSKGVDFNLHIECKNQKTFSIKQWFKQAVNDCVNDKFPVVIFHQNKEIKNGKVVTEAEDFVLIRLEDFCFIVDSNSIVKELK